MRRLEPVRRVDPRPRGGVGSSVMLMRGPPVDARPIDSVAPHISLIVYQKNNTSQLRIAPTRGGFFGGLVARSQPTCKEVRRLSGRETVTNRSRKATSLTSGMVGGGHPAQEEAR